MTSATKPPAAPGFTPERLITTLRVVGDVTIRDARIATLARFVVQAGRPRVELA